MNGNDLPDKDLPVAERIAYLIAGFLRGTLTTSEHNELDAWVVASEENTRLFEQLTDESTIEAGLRWQERLNEDAALEKVKGRIAPKPTRPLWLFALAACVLLFGIGLFLFTRTASAPSPVALSGTPGTPGRDQAVLTLAGGRTIILDAAANGTVASEGGIDVNKGAAGELLYQGTTAETLWHTVSIPRGGQYRLQLSDGSRIWVNAQSKLRFPASFADGERTVELEGEAYFEVAKDARRPFLVAVRVGAGTIQTVEVLGTHFNINGYGDEGGVRTTLLEGSVRVREGPHSVVLKPGEEASGEGNLKVRAGDPVAATAWKDGLFRFRGASIQTIAAQLGRWYDLEVEVRGDIPDHFTATIDRKEPLQDLLKVLEDTRQVRFRLEGNKLIITP
ncbi:FecR family protein [Flaviaesturariibacter amylovorans]|uniref:DUF4974 domain-containing protein n=1 Tax=Flaviaesturariibacter amylovorans TaxID=1084520 RepID=A0ABP8HIK5_9BACT